jgi:hypothetical protein
VAIAREIIIGDEEPPVALTIVLPYLVIEIVGRAKSALAALNVDDCAERALVGASATIDGAWKLMGLNADQSDESPATDSVDEPDDPVGPDAPIGLVVGMDANCHIGAKRPPPARVFGETVEAG